MLNCLMEVIFSKYKPKISNIKGLQMRRSRETVKRKMLPKEFWDKKSEVHFKQRIKQKNKTKAETRRKNLI